MSTISLNNKKIGSSNPIFIIAEIANCHNGSFATAKEMVKVISSTGVDAVKFQLHIPAEEMTYDHPKFITQGQRALTIDQLAILKKYVESFGMHFLCSPFSRKAVDQLDELGIDAYKIGSGETTDLPFIEYVAKKGKPMLISTGMSTVKEIGKTVDLVKSYGIPLLLFHTISIYPPDYSQLNLKYIPILAGKFNILKFG